MDQIQLKNELKEKLGITYLLPHQELIITKIVMNEEDKKYNVRVKVIVAVMICFRLLSGAIATEASHGIIGNIVLIFAVVGFIGKSGSFAKELCGVG